MAATPTSLSSPTVAGDFSVGNPTPVSSVLTNSATDTPIPDEPVTFTLNGTETCTGDNRQHRDGNVLHHAG